MTALVATAIGACGGAAIIFWPLLRRPRAKNAQWTTKATILEQMNEPRPLPMGQKEFEVWSDRIISGALIPTKDIDSLKAILSSMILSLPPTEAFKSDGYFISMLRNAAAKEVANFNFQEIKKRKSEQARDAPA